MHLERKALYNLLRLNWLNDPSLDVEPWQVADYRQMTNAALLDKLRACGINLDQDTFPALTQDCESPEEFADSLLSEDMSIATQDQIYLLIFEMWRRFLPDTLCLSIFCDELDHQINLYDAGELEREESLQDVLDALGNILDENSDQGIDPVTALESIGASCANDLESFLYDYISEQIDDGNLSYASDLIDTFYDYISDVVWFDFLRARTIYARDWEAAHAIIMQIRQETKDEPNLELNLEILSMLSLGGKLPLVKAIVNESIPLLEVEEDFQDILTLCEDFFRCADNEEMEKAIEKILQKRKDISLEKPINQRDQDIALLQQLLKQADSPHSSAN